MLEQLRKHIPKLANAVVQARATGKATYDWETTGAADTARKTARGAQRKATTTRRPRAGKAEKPQADYDKLTASEAVAKLTDFSQEQLGQAIAYERANRKRPRGAGPAGRPLGARAGRSAAAGSRRAVGPIARRGLTSSVGRGRP